MDAIHDVDMKPWISRRRINLKQLLKDRETQLKTNKVNLLQCEDYEPKERDKELSDKLNEFVALKEGEVKPCFLFNSTDEKTLTHNSKCNLHVYQLQLNHAKKMISDRAYKVSYLMKLRTTRKELLMRHLALTNRPALEVFTNPNPTSLDSLIAIVVIQTWPQPSKTTKIKLEKEMLFRSDQSLTELRDQFKCPRDYGVPMDLSENPEQAERIFRGELFKSGFFLIDDTFYNDMRDKNNTDLSAGIVEWASKEVVIRGEGGENKKVGRGIGPFKRLRMEDHKFEDLTFKLGCPYLYLHQGECEHLFTISEIRYVLNNHQLQQTKFPFVTALSIGQVDSLRCYMCKSRPPHWYTRNNNRVPVDPYFFCENCFYSFNYDNDRKKIGNFQAYLYTSACGIPDSVVMLTNKS